MPVASRLTREADFLLVIGARLAFNSTFHSHDYISSTAKIVQTSEKLRLARNKIRADLQTALNRLQLDAQIVDQAERKGIARSGVLPNDASS